jgi:hypothetical protein
MISALNSNGFREARRILQRRRIDEKWGYVTRKVMKPMWHVDLKIQQTGERKKPGELCRFF